MKEIRLRRCLMEFYPSELADIVLEYLFAATPTDYCIVQFCGDYFPLIYLRNVTSRTDAVRQILFRPHFFHQAFDFDEQQAFVLKEADPILSWAANLSGRDLTETIRKYYQNSPVNFLYCLDFLADKSYPDDTILKKYLVIKITDPTFQCIRENYIGNVPEIKCNYEPLLWPVCKPISEETQISRRLEKYFSYPLTDLILSYILIPEISDYVCVENSGVDNVYICRIKVKNVSSREDAVRKILSSREAFEEAFNFSNREIKHFSISDHDAPRSKNKRHIHPDIYSHFKREYLAKPEDFLLALDGMASVSNIRLHKHFILSVHDPTWRVFEKAEQHNYPTI